MGYFLAVGLAVAAVFLVIVLGEVFYLFYWRKRRMACPRPRLNVTVAPVNEGESSVSAGHERDIEAEVMTGGGAEGAELSIDTTCAHYQITALHQDLVAKLFPAAMLNSDDALSSPTIMMIVPPRSLFTIEEETREELESLDMEFAKRSSRRSSRSKSMSDISLSPVGPLSPLSSTPFITPISSPDIFSTPYGTPTYSPLVGLNRSPHSLSSPAFLKTSGRVMHDYAASPPLAPPSPTRPSFPFLARSVSSPAKTSLVSAAVGAAAAMGGDTGVSPSRASASVPRDRPSSEKKVFFFQPVESPQMRVLSPLRSCTSVCDNGTFSPSSPSSSPIDNINLTDKNYSCIPPPSLVTSSSSSSPSSCGHDDEIFSSPTQERLEPCSPGEGKSNPLSSVDERHWDAHSRYLEITSASGSAAPNQHRLQEHPDSRHSPCMLEIAPSPTQRYLSENELQEHTNFPSSSHSPTYASLNSRTPPSETSAVVSPGPGSSPSWKPSSQRSSSALFSTKESTSSLCHPFLTPIVVSHHQTLKSLLASGPLHSPLPLANNTVSSTPWRDRSSSAVPAAQIVKD